MTIDFSHLWLGFPLITVTPVIITPQMSFAMFNDAWQTGVWKGFFLGLPISLGYLMIWKTSMYENWRVALCATVAKCIAELLLIFSVFLGWESLFHVWYMLGPWLMFFSVFYIFFIHTIQPRRLARYVPIRQQWPVDRIILMCLAHIFLGLTEHTHILHRLSAVSMDWDDRLIFGHIFASENGIIDQTVPGTSAIFCFGVIAGYLFANAGWFWFGPFFIRSLMKLIVRISSMKVPSGSPEWLVLIGENFSYLTFITSKADKYVYMLLRAFILAFMYLHVSHYSIDYAPAEALQTVTRSFDSRIMQEMNKPHIHLPPTIRQILERSEAYHSERRYPDPKLKLIDRPEDITEEESWLLDCWFEALDKAGLKQFNKTIYSKRILTRWGPLMSYGKNGNKWGWGRTSTKWHKIKRSQRPENPFLRNSINLFDGVRVWWFRLIHIYNGTVRYVFETVHNWVENYGKIRGELNGGLPDIGPYLKYIKIAKDYHIPNPGQNPVPYEPSLAFAFELSDRFYDEMKPRWEPILKEDQSTDEAENKRIEAEYESLLYDRKAFIRDELNGWKTRDVDPFVLAVARRNIFFSIKNLTDYYDLVKIMEQYEARVRSSPYFKDIVSDVMYNTSPTYEQGDHFNYDKTKVKRKQKTGVSDAFLDDEQLLTLYNRYKILLDRTRFIRQHNEHLYIPPSPYGQALLDSVKKQQMSERDRQKLGYVHSQKYKVEEKIQAEKDYNRLVKRTLRQLRRKQRKFKRFNPTISVSRVYDRTAIARKEYEFDEDTVKLIEFERKRYNGIQKVLRERKVQERVERLDLIKERKRKEKEAEAARKRPIVTKEQKTQAIIKKVTRNRQKLRPLYGPHYEKIRNLRTRATVNSKPYERWIDFTKDKMDDGVKDRERMHQYFARKKLAKGRPGTFHHSLHRFMDLDPYSEGSDYFPLVINKPSRHLVHLRVKDNTHKRSDYLSEHAKHVFKYYIKDVKRGRRKRPMDTINLIREREMRKAFVKATLRKKKGEQRVLMEKLDRMDKADERAAKKQRRKLEKFIMDNPSAKKKKGLDSARRSPYRGSAGVGRRTDNLMVAARSRFDKYIPIFLKPYTDYNGLRKKEDRDPRYHYNDKPQDPIITRKHIQKRLLESSRVDDKFRSYNEEKESSVQKQREQYPIMNTVSSKAEVLDFSKNIEKESPSLLPSDKLVPIFINNATSGSRTTPITFDKLKNDPFFGIFRQKSFSHIWKAFQQETNYRLKTDVTPQDVLDAREQINNRIFEKAGEHLQAESDWSNLDGDTFWDNITLSKKEIRMAMSNSQHNGIDLSVDRNNDDSDSEQEVAAPSIEGANWMDETLEAEYINTKLFGTRAYDEYITKYIAPYFDVQERVYNYQRNPAYQSLVNHTITKMLDHELPTTVEHRSRPEFSESKIRQLMFLYSQTQRSNHFNDLYFDTSNDNISTFSNSTFLNQTKTLNKENLDSSFSDITLYPMVDENESNSRIITNLDQIFAGTTRKKVLPLPDLTSGVIENDLSLQKKENLKVDILDLENSNEEREYKQFAGDVETYYRPYTESMAERFKRYFDPKLANPKVYTTHVDGSFTVSEGMSPKKNITYESKTVDNSKFELTPEHLLSPSQPKLDLSQFQRKLGRRKKTPFPNYNRSKSWLQRYEDSPYELKSEYDATKNSLSLWVQYTNTFSNYPNLGLFLTSVGNSMVSVVRYPFSMVNSVIRYPLNFMKGKKSEDINLKILERRSLPEGMSEKQRQGNPYVEYKKVSEDNEDLHIDLDMALSQIYPEARKKELPYIGIPQDSRMQDLGLFDIDTPHSAFIKSKQTRYNLLKKGKRKYRFLTTVPRRQFRKDKGFVLPNVVSDTSKSKFYKARSGKDLDLIHETRRQVDLQTRTYDAVEDFEIETNSKLEVDALSALPSLEGEKIEQHAYEKRNINPDLGYMYRFGYRDMLLHELKDNYITRKNRKKLLFTGRIKLNLVKNSHDRRNRRVRLKILLNNLLYIPREKGRRIFEFRTYSHGRKPPIKSMEKSEQANGLASIQRQARSYPDLDDPRNIKVDRWAPSREGQYNLPDEVRLEKGSDKPLGHTLAGYIVDMSEESERFVKIKKEREQARLKARVDDLKSFTGDILKEEDTIRKIAKVRKQRDYLASFIASPKRVVLEESEQNMSLKDMYKQAKEKETSWRYGSVPKVRRGLDATLKEEPSLDVRIVNRKLSKTKFQKPLPLTSRSSLKDKNYIESTRWKKDTVNLAQKTHILNSLNARNTHFKLAKTHVVPDFMVSRYKKSDDNEKDDKTDLFLGVTVNIQRTLRNTKSLDDKRYIIDSIPFVFTRPNVLSKSILKRRSSATGAAGPLRTQIVTRDSTKYMFSNFNLCWKPNFNSGISYRQLPIKSNFDIGNMSKFRLPWTADNQPKKGLWYLETPMSSRQVTTATPAKHLGTGALVYDSIPFENDFLNIKNQSDFNENLPFDFGSVLEDLWAIRARIANYDSWLNVLPSNSNDPLYSKAYQTLTQLRKHQDIHLRQVASKARWRLREQLKTRIGWGKSTGGTKSNHKKPVDYSKTYAFLDKLVTSYSQYTTLNSDLRALNAPSYLKTGRDSYFALPDSLISFLPTDNEYQPWLHEELYAPPLEGVSPFVKDTVSNNTKYRMDNLPTVALDEIFFTASPTTIYTETGSNTKYRKGQYYKDIEIPGKKLVVDGRKVNKFIPKDKSLDESAYEPGSVYGPTLFSKEEVDLVNRLSKETLLETRPYLRVKRNKRSWVWLRSIPSYPARILKVFYMKFIDPIVDGYKQYPRKLFNLKLMKDPTEPQRDRYKVTGP